MEYTRLGLGKPGKTPPNDDKVDVDVFNRNNDIIDREFESNDNKIDSIKTIAESSLATAQNADSNASNAINIATESTETISSLIESTNARFDEKLDKSGVLDDNRVVVTGINGTIQTISITTEELQGLSGLSQNVQDFFDRVSGLVQDLNYLQGFRVILAENEFPDQDTLNAEVLPELAIQYPNPTNLDAVYVNVVTNDASAQRALLYAYFVENGDGEWRFIIDRDILIFLASDDRYGVVRSNEWIQFNDGEATVLNSQKLSGFDADHFLSKEEADTTYVHTVDVLTKDNQIEYTPVEPYHPATKEYVDSNSGGSIGGGKTYATVVIGSILSGYSEDDVDYLCSGEQDHLVIANAISELGDAGGTILFLEGTYNVSRTITIGKSNVYLRGVNRDSTIFVLASNAECFRITANYIGISNLSFYTSSELSSGNGMVIRFANNVTVENCRFDFSASMYASYCININFGSNLYLQNNIFIDGTMGINVESGGSNNHFCGNKIIKSQSSTSSSYGIRIINADTGLIITDNIVINHYNGISLTNCMNGVIISNNICYGNSNSGIFASSICQYMTISNNICRNNGSYGLSFSDAASTCTITGNNFSDNSIAQVYLSANTRNNLVVGNIALGGSASILDYGYQNKKEANIEET